MRCTVEEAVAAALKEMGIGKDATARTVLIHDGYFVGYKFRFDGGYVVWLAKENVIEVYDDVGTLLKTVGVETSDEKRVA